MTSKIDEIRKKVEALEKKEYVISPNDFWGWQIRIEKVADILQYRFYKRKKGVKLVIVYHYYHPTNFALNRYFVKMSFWFPTKEEWKYYLRPWLKEREKEQAYQDMCFEELLRGED